mgnify:CR=1 FL=1
MTKKHFESLAKMIADVCKKIGTQSMNENDLRDLLLLELWTVCLKHNSNFSWSRFESRVMELLKD